MILLELFTEFLKIGLFSFGGAYGAIPLIQECVLARGWADDTLFANILAVSESTPGPIMVNAATYIGSRQAGVLGAAAATLGVILPAFLIILFVTAFLRPLLKDRRVQAALRWIKPCLMGVILATGVQMALRCVVVSGGEWSALALQPGPCAVLAVLAGSAALYRKLRGAELSPIALILLAAGLGAVLC